MTLTFLGHLRSLHPPCLVQNQVFLSFLVCCLKEAMNSYGWVAGGGGRGKRAKGSDRPGFKFLFLRTSLVVQWLRICLPMQGTRVCFLAWEIPHASEQLSLYATTTEPAHPEPELCNKRSNRNETLAPQLEKA